MLKQIGLIVLGTMLCLGAVDAPGQNAMPPQLPPAGIPMPQQGMPMPPSMGGPISSFDLPDALYRNPGQIGEVLAACRKRLAAAKTRTARLDQATTISTILASPLGTNYCQQHGSEVMKELFPVVDSLSVREQQTLAGLRLQARTGAALVMAHLGVQDADWADTMTSHGLTYLQRVLDADSRTVAANEPRRTGKPSGRPLDQQLLELKSQAAMMLIPLCIFHDIDRTRTINTLKALLKKYPDNPQIQGFGAQRLQIEERYQQQNAGTMARMREMMQQQRRPNGR